MSAIVAACEKRGIILTAIAEAGACWRVTVGFQTFYVMQQDDPEAVADAVSGWLT